MTDQRISRTGHLISDVCEWTRRILKDAPTAETVQAIDVVHDRASALVLCVRTEGGANFYAKASPRAFYFEPALTERLASACGHSIAPVVAVSESQNFLLMADCGEPLKARRNDTDALDLYCRMVREYAQLQLATSAVAGELAQTGCPSLNPPSAADWTTLTSAMHGKADGDGRQVKDLVDRLLAAGLPNTIHHDDLYASNVFLDTGEFRFIDWGESCLGHPALGMAITLRAAAIDLALPLRSPDFERLRRAYLEPWTGMAPDSVLDDMLDAAMTLGLLHRARFWWNMHINGQLPDDEPESRARDWLARFNAAT